jgi:hypothetical protein
MAFRSARLQGRSRNRLAETAYFEFGLLKDFNESAA